MRTLSPRLRPLAFSLLTLVVVLAGYVVPRSLPILSTAELATYDARLVFESRFRPVPKSDRIAIVGIEDHSLENYGRWPWPRSHIAGILEVLTELGADEVFMDIAFPESEVDATSGDLTGWAFGDQVLNLVATSREELARSRAASTATTGVAGLDMLDAVLGNLDLQVRQWLPRPPDEKLAESLALARQLGVRTTGVFTLQATDAEASTRVPDVLREKIFAILDQRVKDRQKVDLHWFREELDAGTRELSLEHWTALRREYFERFGRAAIAASAGQPRLEDPFAFRDWIRAEYGWMHSQATFQILETELARHLIRTRHVLRLDAPQAGPAGASASAMTPPIPLLAAFLHSVGADNRSNDVDGKLRACPLVWRLADDRLPSGALCLMMHQIPGEATVRFERGPALVLSSGNEEKARIPLRRDGSMNLHWAGRYRDTFPEIPAGKLLDYAARKRQRELAFLERSQAGEYGYILHLRDAARRKMLFAPGTPTSLDEIDRLASSTWGKESVDLKDLFSQWGTKVTTTPDTRAAQDPRYWFTTCESMRTMWEADFLGTYKRRLAKYEKGTDPEKKARQIERLNEEYAPVDRLAREVSELAASLKERIAGRIVFFGSTASSSTDLSPTPFERGAPNVGMYATVLNSFLQRRFVHRPGILTWSLGGPVDWDHVQLPVLIAVCLIVPWMLLNLTAASGFLWMFAFLFAWVGFSMVLFAWRGIWLDVAAPLAACVVGYLTVRTWNFWHTGHVKDVFSSYVDPRIVELVMEDERIWKQLGGVQQNITPFFSDVAGFTTISELLKPEELSQMLTDYLSPMTRLIHENQGTLDKYIGDAIVAFFGSPVANPDHPYLACRAAIEQQRLIVTLRRQWQEENRSWYLRLREAGMEMSFRVGLNTGHAKVGNFGSESTRNYTMIGDTVNLAARLEGANKEYGTSIMASETTYLACREKIVFRELDRLQVKGKTVPVKVYEVLGYPGELDASWTALIPVYTKGIELYLARDFAGARARFEEALQLRPGDGPSQLYVTRCREYEVSPPPEGWDGSYLMTHK